MDLLTDCSRVDLDTLEYPRHLHQGPDTYLRVESADEARVAIADGWRIDLLWPAPDAVVDAIPTEDSTPATPAKKAKR